MVDNNCILRHLKYYWKERKGKRIRQGRRWELSVQERKSQIYKEAQEGFKCNLEGLASLRHFIRLVSGTIKETPEAKKKSGGGETRRKTFLMKAFQANLSS